jgi:TolA-binding protein
VTDEELRELRNKVAEMSRELEEPNMSSQKRQHLENQLVHYQTQLASELKSRGIDIRPEDDRLPPM